MLWIGTAASLIFKYIYKAVKCEGDLSLCRLRIKFSADDINKKVFAEKGFQIYANVEKNQYDVRRCSRRQNCKAGKAVM